jgi:hypothetical protein
MWLVQLSFVEVKARAWKALSRPAVGQRYFVNRRHGGHSPDQGAADEQAPGNDAGTPGRLHRRRASVVIIAMVVVQEILGQLQAEQSWDAKANDTAGRAAQKAE